MALESGAKLGPFEITGLLGRGGMGEVYRARDTKLGRDVAIKVLSSALTGHSEMLARFEREALSLAQLDHPNIGALHEFRDERGIHFLVMQLVEGETLADRISRGPMPVSEVRQIFSQIAEGLEAAHDRGIVHRDLKPANIKVTADDRVKILDFGLARSIEGSAAPGAPTPTPSQPISPAAPTLPATPSRAPAGGSTFIGTPQYMSPEQARGKPVDRRADIWAFGVCLYQASTGTLPFDGETISDVVTAILRDEPDWDLLPADLPRNLHEVLRRCLERDPRFRLRDIGEAWVLLHRLGEQQPSPVATAVEREVTRFTISFPNRHHLSPTFLPFAMAPDGSMVVCSLVTEGMQQLYLRRMDRLEFVPIPGTERGRMPFFSPNGEWLGFSQERSIRVVPIAGGTPRTIVECRSPAIGAVWTQDDLIVWGELNSGLQKVNVDGTQRQQLVTLDEEEHEVWQTIFGAVGRDGWILGNTVYGQGQQTRLEFISSRTGERRGVGMKETNTIGRCSEAGHLVFVRGRDLFAVRTTGEAPQVAGRPINVVRGVALDGDRVPLFDLSASGSLVYVPAEAGKAVGKIYWVTRRGDREEIAAAPRDYAHPRFSPDGDSFAVTCEDRSGIRQLHVFDPFRGVLEKITAERRGADGPVWHPSGNSLAFTELGQDQKQMSMRSISLDARRSVNISDAAISQLPSDYSPDGRVLLFVKSANPIDYRIFACNETGEEEAIVDTRARNVCPRFHPSGNYIAYASNDSGRWEVYVLPFRRPGRRIQVSVDGGSDPVWARNGAELFYRNGNRLMSASIEGDEPLRLGRPEALFDFPFGASVNLYTACFDVHPDGERFVMVDLAGGERGGQELVVVRNWGRELEELFLGTAD